MTIAEHEKKVLRYNDIMSKAKAQIYKDVNYYNKCFKAHDIMYEHALGFLAGELSELVTVLDFLGYNIVYKDGSSLIDSVYVVDSEGPILIYRGGEK